MIDIKLENGEIKRFIIDGDLADIGADVCEVINIVYNVIAEEDEESGKFFKENMIREANEDLLWERNEFTMPEEKTSDIYNEAIKMMKDIFDEKGETKNDKD